MTQQHNFQQVSQLLSKEEWAELIKRSPIRAYWLIFHCWGIILSSWLIIIIFPHPLVAIVSIAFIASRQLGLAILMHEGAHFMISNHHQLNDWISRYILAWPIAVDMDLYRKAHRMHHRFTRTEKDPDNSLYTPFPVTRASMARKILRDLSGITFVRQQFILLARFHAATGAERQALSRFYQGILICNLFLLLLLTLAGVPHLWLTHWILPLATFYQLFLRLRNIGEHAAVTDLNCPLKNSRSMEYNPIERFFVTPYWVNYHLEHHLHPGIPCYRLKAFHELLLEKGLGQQMEIKKSFLTTFKLMIRTPKKISSRPHAS